MTETKHIKISDYNYPLPDERIAKFPLPVRDQSKLLVYRHGEVSETVFTSLPDYMEPGMLMVFNNTKVIQARLHFRKETGALIEIFCLEPIQPNDYVLNFQQTHHAAWLCMIGNLKKWKEGPLHKEMTVKGKTITLTATRGECHGTSHWVDFTWDNPEVTFADILEVFGELPIPPYLNRETQESDKETYQTVGVLIPASKPTPWSPQSFHHSQAANPGRIHDTSSRRDGSASRMTMSLSSSCRSSRAMRIVRHGNEVWGAALAMKLSYSSTTFWRLSCPPSCVRFGYGAKIPRREYP